MCLSSSSPRKTTSTSTVAASQGAHRFEIAGYSRQKGLGVSNYVNSGTFDVGGYKWSMRFYPDGHGAPASEAGYVSAYLELSGFFGSTRASCDLRIIHPTTGVSTSVCRMTEPRVFSCGSDNRWTPRHPKFMKQSELEEFVHGDRLVLEFVVIVFAEPRVSEVRPVAARDLVLVPPPDLSGRLAKLLESNDLADVTFVVGGKAFPAHRIILAAGSPVFNAELYGAMKEKDMDRIHVEDMQPAVFQVMLHFIYTDSLPTMDDATDDNMAGMIQHLLVAADRYGVERLKLASSWATLFVTSRTMCELHHYAICINSLRRVPSLHLAFIEVDHPSGIRFSLKSSNTQGICKM